MSNNTNEHPVSPSDIRLIAQLNDLIHQAKQLDDAIDWVSFHRNPYGHTLSLQLATDVDVERFATAFGCTTDRARGDKASWLRFGTKMGDLHVSFTGPHHPFDDEQAQADVKAALDAAGPGDVVIGGRGDGPVVLHAPDCDDGRVACPACAESPLSHKS